MVQLSHPHRTTGKTIALTRQSFVSKVMSLLFNMLFVSKVFLINVSVDEDQRPQPATRGLCILEKT